MGLGRGSKVSGESSKHQAGFRADPALQARIEELASKTTEGQLTEAEKAEYAGYARANKFVAILQRKARQLSGSGSYNAGRTTSSGTASTWLAKRPSAGPRFGSST